MQFNLAQATSILARTPSTLVAILGDLPDEWSRATEGPDTFSPFDVVGHLIDGEETDWIPRARIILAQGPEPRFEPFDRFRHRTRNVGRTLESLLSEFAELREANLDLLILLAPDGGEPRPPRSTPKPGSSHASSASRELGSP